MKNKILKELDYALSSDTPVGFFGIVLSRNESHDRIIPTIVDVFAESSPISHQNQQLIHDKLWEIAELLK